MRTASRLTLAFLLGVILTNAGCDRPGSASRGRRPEVHAKWPFDAKEAKQRQEETAKALGMPVEKTVDLGGGVKMEFALIPAGEFMMGSGDSIETLVRKSHSRLTGSLMFENEYPQHRVRVTKPFYIAKYEVTQDQWEPVIGRNPAKFPGARNPVEKVSWHDCQDFANRLSAKSSGLTCALPTEAEWEWACRAGTSTAFHTGEALSMEQANCGGSYPYAGDVQSRHKTMPVGGFKPNAWGLYDMHGNVWEWCEDWYGEDYYKHSPKHDPRGPTTGGSRVIRGGSWDVHGMRCRSSSRDSFAPKARDNAGGLRVVLRIALD